MFENESWRMKLQEQYDKAVVDLMNLLDAQGELRDQIEAQMAFINLLAELLDPSD